MSSFLFQARAMFLQSLKHKLKWLDSVEKTFSSCLYAAADELWPERNYRNNLFKHVGTPAILRLNTSFAHMDFLCYIHCWHVPIVSEVLLSRPCMLLIWNGTCDTGNWETWTFHAMQACSLRAWKQVFGRMEGRKLNLDFKWASSSFKLQSVWAFGVVVVTVCFLCWGSRWANR